MRWLSISLLFFLLASCVTDPQTGQTTLDLKAINSEMKLAYKDLGDALILVQGDDKLYPAVAKFRGIVGTIQSSLEEYINGQTPDTSKILGSIDLALSLSDSLIKETVSDEGTAQRIRFVVAVSRIVLRRVEFYIKEKPVV